MPGNDDPGRRDHRPHRGLVGVDAGAGLPPAAHAHPAVGAHQGAADRDRRRGALSQLGARSRARPPARFSRSAGLRCSRTRWRCTASRGSRHRPLFVVPVPLLTPKLSSRWLALVTSVDLQTARNLVESMSNEVVVHDNALERLVDWEPTPFDDAVRQALAEREATSAHP